MKRIFCVMALGAVLLAPLSRAAAEEQKEEKKLSDFKPNLGGYIEGWYRMDFSGLSAQTTASKRVDNEFRIRRARLTASGNISDELGYKLTASLDGPSPASSASSVRLWDAYLSYRAHPNATVYFGQLKYDFSLEGTEATPDRVPVLRAEAVNDIAGKLGTKGGSFRDIGVRVAGSFKDFSGLAYGFSVINGSGINTGDNNNEKDFVGRVTVKPLEGLTAGLSGYLGTGQDETSATEVRERAFGLEAEYLRGGVRLRGEYLAAEWENWDVASGVPSEGKTQKPQGWYLQASYRLSELPLEFLGRYEDYERDRKTPGTHLKTTTLGATYYLKGKTRISANYLLRDSGENPSVTAQETDATGGAIGDLFLLQALLAF